MRQAAADGAAITDCQMRDVRHRRAKNWEVSCDHRRNLKLVMARERAYPDLVIRFLDESEIGNTIDIDQDRRLYQPKVEHRHKALPAGKDLGLAICLRQRSDGTRHTVDNHILKCCWFHGRRRT